MEDIEALHMSRREGPSHGGGTPVILSGKNFGELLMLTSADHFDLNLMLAISSHNK